MEQLPALEQRWRRHAGMVAWPTALLFALVVVVLALGTTACDTPNSPSEVLEDPEISIAGPDNTVVIGGTLQLEATITPDSLPQAVAWTSSDSLIGLVSADGEVSGVSPGKLIVTAESVDDPELVATYTMEVVDCPEPRTVNDDIAADSTWENWIESPLCFDYIVTVSTTVRDGLLTIEAGAVIGFETGRLLITSTAGLNAVGIEENPIRLTGVLGERGEWNGVMLQGTQHASNEMAWTSIEYGGGSGFGGGIQPSNLIFVQQARMPLEQIELSQSAGYGLYLDQSSEIPGGYKGGSITENELGAAQIHTAVVHLLSDSDLVPNISGNDRDRIDVVPGTMSADGTWADFDAPYNVLESPTKLAIEGELTVAPGATVLFEPNQAMSVSGGGSLLAIGLPTAPITFSGTSPVRGSWRGIQIQDTHSKLDYVYITYGGGPGGTGGLQPANLKLSTGATGVETRLTIKNSTLLESAGYGISSVSFETDIEVIEGNTFTANDLGPAYLPATLIKHLTANNAYSGNVVDEVVIQVLANSILNEAVTWRDIGVPYRVIGGAEATPTLTIQNSQFTVEPGVEMRMTGNLGFNIRSSSVTMEGTQQDPIRMVGDGAPWRGLQLFEGSASFDWVDFVNVGSSSWGGVNEAAAVSITSAGSISSSASFTGNVTSTGGNYALAFSFGPTTAQGCIGPTYIPPPDEVSDHCSPP